MKLLRQHSGTTSHSLQTGLVMEMYNNKDNNNFKQSVLPLTTVLVQFSLLAELGSIDIIFLQLWSILTEGEVLTSRTCSQWTEIGFQGNDPMTDFRGMGQLALDQLMYVYKKHAY